MRKKISQREAARLRRENKQLQLRIRLIESGCRPLEQIALTHWEVHSSITSEIRLARKLGFRVEVEEGANGMRLTAVRWQGRTPL